MRTILQSATVALFVLTMGSACRHAPKADEAKATEAQTIEGEKVSGTIYRVNTSTSSIKWLATKPTGSHNGTFMIKEGALGLSGNSIQNGRFMIDVADLTAYDEDGSANPKLQGHLKSPDFFDVAKFGTAAFGISSVQPINGDAKSTLMKDATHMVTGNLKIKDITKSISFPARIVIQADQVIADAVFNINRTSWGINYHSDKSLGDKFINEEVNITIHLDARK